MSCSDGLPVVVGMLSTAIARGRSTDELTILAALFTQLGDSLALIAAARPTESDASAGSCSGE